MNKSFHKSLQHDEEYNTQKRNYVQQNTCSASAVMKFYILHHQFGLIIQLSKKKSSIECFTSTSFGLNTMFINMFLLPN